jgi:hypothetical protein
VGLSLSVVIDKDSSDTEIDSGTDIDAVESFMPILFLFDFYCVEK